MPTSYKVEEMVAFDGKTAKILINGGMMTQAEYDAAIENYSPLNVKVAAGGGAYLTHETIAGGVSMSAAFAKFFGGSGGRNACRAIGAAFCEASPLQLAEAARDCAMAKIDKDNESRLTSPDTALSAEKRASRDNARAKLDKQLATQNSIIASLTT